MVFANFPCKIQEICNSYRTVPSTIWDIFFEFWFFVIFSEPLGEENIEKSEREKYIQYCTSKSVITGLSSTWKIKNITQPNFSLLFTHCFSLFVCFFSLPSILMKSTSKHSKKRFEWSLKYQNIVLITCLCFEKKNNTFVSIKFYKI